MCTRRGLVRPCAAGQVSAGRALTWQQVLSLRSRGVKVAALTEGAGLSLSGYAPLDALPPLPQRYDLPPLTATLVNAAVSSGRRVVAVGTTRNAKHPLPHQMFNFVLNQLRGSVVLEASLEFLEKFETLVDLAQQHHASV